VVQHGQLAFEPGSKLLSANGVCCQGLIEPGAQLGSLKASEKVTVV
jgi:hypothetical protein